MECISEKELDARIHAFLGKKYQQFPELRQTPALQLWRRGKVRHHRQIIMNFQIIN